MQPVETGNAWLFDHRMLPNVDARQRIAVDASIGNVSSIGLILDPLPGYRITDLADILADTLEWANRKVGTPDEVIETGDYSNQLSDDLRNGSFVRLYHWEKDGQQVRLGIPPRLDGLVRVELLQQTKITRTIPGQNWGLNDVYE